MDFLRSMRKTKKTSKNTKVKKADKSAASRRAKKETKVDKEKSKRVQKSSKSTRKPKKKSHHKLDNKKVPAEAMAGSQIFDPNVFTFKIDKVIGPEPDNHIPAQRQAFEIFASIVTSTGADGLIKEYFEQIVPFIPTGYYDRAIFDQNKEFKKNRYKDVVCNDKTRVILKDGRPGDYIHANYVRGLRPLYILTQGPVKDTSVDFWRMIVQEEVSAICMLCELMENGKIKCDAYFPDYAGATLTIGDFTITCTEDSAPDVHTQLRQLQVLDKSNGKTRKVSHYKIVTWPDKTVALSNLSILRTHRIIRKFSGAIVVHCSAGVGRTGTFTAIEIGIQCLLNGKTFKVAELVKALRHCRLHSVQMDTQFLMLAEAILDCGVNFKYIEDSQLLEAIIVFKAKAAEYVEAHPPPVEAPTKASTTTDEKLPEAPPFQIPAAPAAPPVQTPPPRVPSREAQFEVLPPIQPMPCPTPVRTFAPTVVPQQPPAPPPPPPPPPAPPAPQAPARPVSPVVPQFVPQPVSPVSPPPPPAPRTPVASPIAPQFVPQPVSPMQPPPPTPSPARTPIGPPVVPQAVPQYPAPTPPRPPPPKVAPSPAAYPTPAPPQSPTTPQMPMTKPNQPTQPANANCSQYIQ